VTESEDWTPELGPPAGDQYKWGLDGDTGELTVWEVGGPGDGFPSHDTYLATAWGRRPRYDGRDQLGYAIVRDADVLLVAYQEAELPPKLTHWAEAAFPGRPVAFASKPTTA
jgi:hypothetical protein